MILDNDSDNLDLFGRVLFELFECARGHHLLDSIWPCSNLQTSVSVLKGGAWVRWPQIRASAYHIIHSDFVRQWILITLTLSTKNLVSAPRLPICHVAAANKTPLSAKSARKVGVVPAVPNWKTREDFMPSKLVSLPSKIESAYLFLDCLQDCVLDRTAPSHFLAS
jgi:hypothetical protein